MQAEVKKAVAAEVEAMKVAVAMVASEVEISMRKLGWQGGW